jgi:hypothetical protein
MSEQNPRRLGVVEAFVAVRDQCPRGPARATARSALEAIQSREPGVLREQAWLVLNSIKGWRGDRAGQVHQSLLAFLEESGPDPSP